MGPWTNFTECTAAVVCDGDGKKYRTRTCLEDMCIDDDVANPVKIYMRDENNTDSEDCNLECAGNFHFLYFLLN